MNQGPRWTLLMKKTRVVKSRATVPLTCVFLLILWLFVYTGVHVILWRELTVLFTSLWWHSTFVMRSEQLQLQCTYGMIRQEKEQPIFHCQWPRLDYFIFVHNNRIQIEGLLLLILLPWASAGKSGKRTNVVSSRTRRANNELNYVHKIIYIAMYAVLSVSMCLNECLLFGHMILILNQMITEWNFL